METWNNGNDYQEPDLAVDHDLRSTIGLYQETVEVMEQVIAELNKANPDHWTLHLCVRKLSSLVNSLQLDGNNAERQEDLYEVFKSVGLINKKLEEVLKISDPPIAYSLFPSCLPTSNQCYDDVAENSTAHNSWSSNQEKTLETKSLFDATFCTIVLQELNPAKRDIIVKHVIQGCNVAWVRVERRSRTAWCIFRFIISEHLFSEAGSSGDAGQASIGNLIVGKTSTSFDEVIGLEEAKTSLNEAIIMPLLYPQLFSGKRKPWNRILLYGPPGTGKSRLAHAVANKIDSLFYSVSSSDILSSFFGQSEKMIRDLFKHARSDDGRSVIFMDEIDSLCRRRTDKEDEAVRRVKTELLSNMDGMATHDPVFILCATNCPWEIDPAFLRRFQKRVYIPLPCMKSRIEILKLHSGDDCSLTESEWALLGELTAGYSGSDLAVLVNAALFQPVRELQHTARWSYGPDGKYRPCPDSQSPDVTRHFRDLHPSSVLTRRVNVGDFKDCLKLNKATVSPDDLQQFETFTTRYGMVGS